MRNNRSQSGNSTAYSASSQLRRVLVVAVCLVAVGAGIVLFAASRSRAAAPPSQKETISKDGIWSDVAESSISTARARALAIDGDKYRTLRLDANALNKLLAQAPMEFSKQANNAPLELTIPMPDGTFDRFQIVESPMMESELAAQYPDIKNYSGHGIDDPTSSMRFDLTPDGFHAFILSSEGTILVSPYSKNDTTNYISYYLRDDPKESSFNCIAAEAAAKSEAAAKLGQAPNEAPQIDNGASLHTYRLAVAATGEYTALSRLPGDTDGQAQARALAAINTTVMGVNAIYAVEVSIRLTLIGNENAIIYTDSGTDPYTSGDLSCANMDGTPQSCLLSENQSNLDTTIGSVNYDIGQVFDTGGNGLASLAVVCNNTRKGRGTSGANSVLLTAHEMGHQFGATHTFNDNTNGSCGSLFGSSQRTAESAYEPGSGSTIMSYAGTCGAADLQQIRNSYFHIRSLEQIVVYTTGDGGGSGCDVETPTNRNGIVVTQYSPEITVPARTPFMLSIQAVDVSSNPQTLSYNWEEYDLGAASPPEGDNGNRPLFRSRIPVARVDNFTQTFPALQYILNNDNIPPPTYQCGMDGMGNPINCLTGESRTLTTRNMTFQATMRDNISAIHSASVQVHVVDSGAPFAITNLNSPDIKWAQGTRQEIIWNTANTASAPFNVANVKISLSPNGGISFDQVLAESTPNDGSESVLVPEGILFENTTNARVKIESIIDGNFNSFFDISNTDITIRPIGVRNTNDSGDGSLRQAILDSNSDPGLTNIPFSIPGAGIQTINLQSELPVITKPIILDGWSQGGESYSGPPLVELNGTGAGTSANGLTIFAGNSTVNGLAINRFSLSGIDLRINGGNFIEGCYIGTNAAGTAVAGNGASGVFINGTPNNRLGSPTTLGQFRRNIIAGNNIGVLISGSNAASNSLYYNLIGTNADGTRLSNTLDGIRITDAPNNIIGGTRSLAGGVVFIGTGNVISGNGMNNFSADGIEITGSTATGNTIQANLIGLTLDGTAGLGNLGSGIRIENAPNNNIGGTGAAAGNTISGNSNQGGIALIGSGSTGTTIQGNYFGTNSDGSAAIANNANDIYVESSNNLIGGTTAGARNVISGFAVRGGIGIYLFYGAAGNVIQGNYIGTDATGAVALSVNGTGIVMLGTINTIIGGTTPAARNIISGNGTGISVDGGTTNLRIEGNYIGTNPAGTTAVANRFSGVNIGSSNNNTIGGTIAGAGNLISGNNYRGVVVSEGTGNKVQGNYIGTNAAGTSALGNDGIGVVLFNSTNNLVGGATASARNIISANGGDGIYVAYASGNIVQGNYVGTDASGTANLGNGNTGVEVAASNNNVIGGTGFGEGNLIAFNGIVDSRLGYGVRVSSVFVDGVFSGSGNRIRGNSIFSNVRLGIDLLGGSENSFGVTANDSCDADTGIGASNELQNYPVLSSATSSGGSTTIAGTLNSKASTAFNIDFYTNPSCDASGNGEGQTYLGSSTVNTDASCNANINVTLAVGLTADQVVTATATDPQGNSSEFSACIGATLGTPAITAAGGTVVNESCAPANSAIDPGERATVNLKLMNNGNGSTANLVATLQSGGGVIAPSGPQNYGAIAPAGMAGRDFSFTAASSLMSGQTITVTLQLQDGASNLGTISFNFSAGPSPCGGVRLVVTSGLTRVNPTTVQATITVQNTGSETANNVMLTTAKLGSTNGTPLPKSLGNIVPGGSASTVVTFTNSTPGAASTLSLGGSFMGGSFSSTKRVTIP